jgi:large subunit ribosomal protein L35
MRSKAFKRHLLSSKTTKQKRHLSGDFEVSPADAAKLNRMLPYK